MKLSPVRIIAHVEQASLPGSIIALSTGAGAREARAAWAVSAVRPQLSELVQRGLVARVDELRFGEAVQFTIEPHKLTDAAHAIRGIDGLHWFYRP